jgi:transposase-like protein
MTLNEIFQLKAESDAEKYLLHIGVIHEFNKCIHCNSSLLGRIRRGKIKCYSCKKEWDPSKNSFIENYRVSLLKFILTVKCYSLNISALTCAQEVQLNHQTVAKIYENLRRLIAGEVTINPILNEDIVFTLSLCNEENGFCLSLPNHNINSSATIIGYLRLTRIRHKDKEFGYKVNLDFDRSLLTSSHEGKLWKLATNLKRNLENLSHIDLEKLYLSVNELLFRFGKTSTQIFSDTLVLVRNSKGG